MNQKQGQEGPSTWAAEVLWLLSLQHIAFKLNKAALKSSLKEKTAMLLSSKT